MVDRCVDGVDGRSPQPTARAGGAARKTTMAPPPSADASPVVAAAPNFSTAAGNGGPPREERSAAAPAGVTFRVAVVGGGIAGACAASVLSSAGASALAASASASASPNGSVAAASTNGSNAAAAAAAAVEPSAQAGLIPPAGVTIRVDLFDQGRRGVGGRSSHRRVQEGERDGDGGRGMAWDHGCQFFRADTERFQPIVSNWMKHGFVSEWSGRFASAGTSEDDDDDGRGFFGMPSKPPFYVGSDGMQSVTRGLLELCSTRGDTSPFGEKDGYRAPTDASDNDGGAPVLRVFTGTRVSRLERRGDDGDVSGSDRPASGAAAKGGSKWSLFGTGGEAAYHDTPERAADSALAESGGEVRLGQQPRSGSGSGSGSSGDERVYYDAVLLTDASSSFGTWHRASAGVPEAFADRVRRRVGARVPLFTAMVAFDRRLDVPFDAASFGGAGGSAVGERLWFAARSNSKPGMDGDSGDDEDGGGGAPVPPSRDCWTLVSTPEYALDRIEETPMQDPATGEFVPQSAEYLTSVPGPELVSAFRAALTSPGGILGSKGAMDPADFPNTVRLDAQRWGSAMPCHRHLDERSATRRVLSGVPYDSGSAPLAPTRLEKRRDTVDEMNFLADDERMLFQAGDMVSRFTPGFEGAALSGMDAAEHILQLLKNKRAS